MAEQNEKDSVQTTSGSGEHREKDLSIMDYSRPMEESPNGFQM